MIVNTEAVSYSYGQAKPTNPLSRQGVQLGVRFFQILTQIVEMNQKTHLRSFSHDVLAWPEFWARKPQLFVRRNEVWIGLGGEVDT
jgi:hypothetical protein